MKLETGTPLLDGRYVVYVPGLMGWLEPKLVLWQKGGWTFTYSTEAYPDKVHCWIGPLPVISQGEVARTMLFQENPQWTDEERAKFNSGIYPPLEINKLPMQEFDL